jgi:cupin fold WbuC family metalloprotein
LKVVNLSNFLLDELTVQALHSPRRRQFRNLHGNYKDAVQRLFNAIDVDSYIRPHRHWQDPKTETLLGIRGSLTFVTFSDTGDLLEAVRFGQQGRGFNPSIGVEVPPGVWHTVIANEPGSIVFELKAGPFDPLTAKEWAGWAPAEESQQADAYLADLRRRLVNLV